MSRSRPEQAVLLHVGLLPHSEDENAARTRLAALGDELAQAVGAQGEVEEPVSQGDQAIISVYGPDADRLFEIAQGVLRAHDVARGSFALRRYGDPGAPEERSPLGSA